MELSWIDDRWHLDGQPIHAGTVAEIRWPDRTWETVRIESGDRGRKLFANFRYHGLGLAVRIDDGAHELRWPL